MKPITIRFPEELVEKIKQLAEEDRRSFNAEVLVLLDEALAARATTRTLINA